MSKLTTNLYLIRFEPKSVYESTAHLLCTHNDKKELFSKILGEIYLNKNSGINHNMGCFPAGLEPNDFYDIVSCYVSNISYNIGVKFYDSTDCMTFENKLIENEIKYLAISEQSVFMIDDDVHDWDFQ